MNNLSLSILEKASMESKNNFETALLVVGKYNPFRIKHLSLKNGKRFNSVNELSKNELIKLGELNLYRKLNGTLGKNRKYSLRKIRYVKSVKEKIKEQDNGYTEYKLSVKVPAKEYLKIVCILFEMLKQVDGVSKSALLKKENRDIYGGKKAYSSTKLRAVAPIQTGIIMSAVIPEEHRRYVQCLEKLKDEIRKSE